MQGNQGIYGIPRKSATSVERLVFRTPLASSNTGGIAFSVLQENTGSCWQAYLNDPLDTSGGPGRTRITFTVSGHYALSCSINSFTAANFIAFVKNKLGTDLTTLNWTDGSVLAVAGCPTNLPSVCVTATEYFYAGDSLVIAWNSASGAPAATGFFRITRLPFGA